MNDSFDSVSFSPKIVLAVAAHPDDIEFCMGGSIARWIRDGAEVYYLILTNGCNGATDTELSTEKICEIRHTEQQQAANILGVTNVFFCTYQDCNLELCNNVKRDIVRYIRKLKPDTVLTIDPTMSYSIQRGSINHSDHRAAGQAVLDSVFPLARDHLAFPELLHKEELEPHKVTTVLLVNYDKANFYSDIVDTIDLKIKALAAHKSQFTDMKTVEQYVKKYARESGIEGCSEYTEAFIRLDIPEL